MIPIGRDEQRLSAGKRFGSEKVSELIFQVAESSEGGYTARALGASICTKSDDLYGLHENVRDAVRCHFDEGETPAMIRLHFVQDEVIAL